MVSFPKLPKSFTALFKRISGIASETLQAAQKEPPFIVSHGLINHNFSKGNKFQLESTTFHSPSDNHDSPAVKRLIEIAEGRGLNVESGTEKDGRQKIFIAGDGTRGVVADFSRLERALENKAKEARSKLPPVNLPSDVKWPGSDALLSEHIQYLIDAREYVSQLDTPEGLNYVQVPHSDAPVVGDVKRPAVLDASYDYRFLTYGGGMSGQIFASISLPNFTPLERDYGVVTNYGHAQGLSLGNIDISLGKMLEEVGVEILDVGKTGADVLSGTFYTEYDIHLNDYERARAVIDAYVRSGITDADELIEHIKRGDRVRQGMDIPGARVDLNLDESMRIDVPVDYDLGGFNDVGIEGAEDFEQILYDAKEHDARPGYMTIIVPAQSVPEALKAPVDPDEPFAARSPNAPDGPITSSEEQPETPCSDDTCDI